MSLRSINGAHEFSNSSVTLIALSFRAKSRNPVAVLCGNDTGSFDFAAVAQDYGSCTTKTRIEISIRVFKSYPADAVQADHPFPSVTGG